MSNYWGFHSMFDCNGCDIQSISDGSNIKEFTKQLIKEIDMKQYGETILEHFATHDPSKGGYTMLAMIETSNLSAHFVEASGEAYIDVFSCKDFDAEKAKEVIGHFFKPNTIKHTRVLRKA